MFSEPTPENLLILFRPGLPGFNLDPFSNPTPRKEEVFSAFCLRQIGSLESESRLSADPFSNPTPRKEEVVYAFFLRQIGSLEDSTPGRHPGRVFPWCWSPGFPRILSRTPPPEKKKFSLHSAFVRSGHSSLRPSAMHSVSLFPVKRRYEPKATEILRRHDTAPLEKRLCSCYARLRRHVTPCGYLFAQVLSVSCESLRLVIFPGISRHTRPPKNQGQGNFCSILPAGEWVS